MSSKVQSIFVCAVMVMSALFIGLSAIDSSEESGVPENETVENPVPRPAMLSSSSSASIVIGADSDQYDGQGMGRLYKSSSNYYSYDYPYWYFYRSGSYYESRPWAVYDLSNLAKYKDITITSGQIHYWKYNRYYVKEIDVWTMNSIPYDTSGSSSKAEDWFNEIGAGGSIKMGSESYTGSSDSTREDIWITITSGGIAELNSRLSTGNYDFSMGAKIKEFTTGTYGYMYWGDIRLELEFTYTAMPDGAYGEIAVGDELAGYGHSTTKYDFYNYVYLYSSSSYVGFATWDTTQLSSLIPTQGPDGENVIITGICLRFNLEYRSGVPTVTVNNMTNDPKTTTSWPVIFNDAKSGKYDSFTLSGTPPCESEWDLGPDALDDFNATRNGTPNFFAVGFTSTGYGRLVSLKLVIKWRIEYPPRHTLRLGPDNPEHAGQAHGRSRLSGSNAYCYSEYYTYIYKSSTTDYRGWVTFDLKDVEAWEGVEVKSASLVIHSYYRYYITEVKFTALETTPYDGMGSAEAMDVHTESGPSGTQIGSVSFATRTALTPYTFKVPLNSAAVNAINTKLESNETYKTFGIGSYVTDIWGGYSYGYARFTDVRLELSFEYDEELQSTEVGEGVAFGDDITGHIYQYSSSTLRPYGYVYCRKSSSYEYRGYYQWNVPGILSAFEQVNVSNTNIKKVSLRFNHRHDSLSGISVRHLMYNMSDAGVSNMDKFTDCGNGTLYFSSGSVSSSFNEYEWDLGPDAVADFQNAFSDNNLDYFGVGITTSASGYSYDYGPRLVLEWDMSFDVLLVNETTYGYEGQEVLFDASPSTTGSGSMLYEWDWDHDGIFDMSSTSPYAWHTWWDDFEGNITLRVTDIYTGRSGSRDFLVIIQNVDPSVNTSAGVMIPDPADEGTGVVFSGFTVDDPGLDTWTYLWDFDFDGVFDAGGNCNGTAIPPESWVFGDDYMGNVSLVVMDDDGGSNNITESHDALAEPDNEWTGYVYYYGTKYVSSTIYYRYQYTLDYQRGWAKLDLSMIPADAHITKVVFKGEVAYNYGTETFGVRLLNSDPTTAVDMTVFNEAGYGTRLCGFSGSVGVKSHDLTNWATTSPGKNNFTQALDNGWIAFGFDYETVESGSNYGYMRGYSDNKPYLEIEYEIREPGCLIPIVVINVAPNIGIVTAPGGDEATVITHISTATDVGSDDLSFSVNWGDGTSSGPTIYYNDGVGPDPYPSLYGTYPFSVTDTVWHIYGDDGVYPVTLTVEDDDGGISTHTTNVTVNNIAPAIDSVSASGANEGAAMTCSAQATDQGSDDLTFTWNWGDGTSDTVMTYYNDGTGPDPYPSPWGTYPFTASDSASHTYGDNGVYTITLTVTDDDGGTTSATTDVTIDNVAPIIDTVTAPGGDEGTALSYLSTASDQGSDDLTFTWDWGDGTSDTVSVHYNDGTGPDPYPSPWGTYPFSATDSVNHIYGDNGVYMITLTVTDDDGGSIFTTRYVTIDNAAPNIDAITASGGDEGAVSSYLSTATDQGSDDLKFTWNWGDGTSDVVSIYFNDGTGPDPYPSPWGTYPFSATDSVDHTYGDNGVYTITLTVEDDDWGAVTDTTDVTIDNVAPAITPFGPFTAVEGMAFDISAIATDQGSDDLTFTWEFEMGPTVTSVYYNDGTGPDPYPSPWGTFPFSVTDMVSHMYGDDGVYSVSLTVEDDDGGVATYSTTITVGNVAPEIKNIEAYVLLDFTLRAAGEKWHNVEMYITADGEDIAFAEVVRYPGDPDDQSVTLWDVKCEVTKVIEVTVLYTPLDDPVNGQQNGATPCWVNISFEDGGIKLLKHNFNVNQPDKWEWNIEVNKLLAGHAITFESTAEDSGSDDLTFTWDWGDGSPLVETLCYNDGVNPEPVYDPGINEIRSPWGACPFSAADVKTHTFTAHGSYAVALTVTDDDGGSVGVVLNIILS